MIIDAPNNVKIWDEITPGEVFVFEGEFYLRTEPIVDFDDNNINAVRLNNGEPLYFWDKDAFYVCPHCVLKVD